MIEYDQRLPLDLTHPVHRRALRAHLDSTRRLEIREVPDKDAHGWIGRAHETLGLPRSSSARERQRAPAAPRHTGPTGRHLPGAA